MLTEFNGFESNLAFMNMAKIPARVSEKDKKSVESQNHKLVSVLEEKLKSLNSIKSSGPLTESQIVEMKNLSSKISIYKRAQQFYHQKEIDTTFFAQPEVIKPKVTKAKKDVSYLSKDGNMLKINPAEWAKARSLFQSDTYKGKNKISYKDDSALNHSFMIIGEKMVALSKQKHDTISSKKGAFGRLKIAQDSSGKNYALKMEVQLKEGDPGNSHEMNVQRELKRFHGSATRKSTSGKLTEHYKSRVDQSKGYTKGYVLIDLEAGANIDEGYLRTGLLEKNALVFKAAINCAQALLNFHEAGYVHRDVKPENYMMSETGEVSLVDFGLAKKYRSDSGKDDFSIRLPAGTPGYMPPEIFQEPYTHTRASDVYSLGVMLNKEFGIAIPEMLDAISDNRPSLEKVVGYLSVLEYGKDAVKPDSFAAWQELTQAEKVKMLGELDEGSAPSSPTKKF